MGTNTYGQAVLLKQPFRRLWKVTVFCCFFIPLPSTFWTYSVQQCPGEHEDPAAQPDCADGDLGAPSDPLPPPHHQLHGLLQLGET